MRAYILHAFAFIASLIIQHRLWARYRGMESTNSVHYRRKKKPNPATYANGFGGRNRTEPAVSQTDSTHQ